MFPTPLTQVAAEGNALFQELMISLQSRPGFAEEVASVVAGDVASRRLRTMCAAAAQHRTERCDGRRRASCILKRKEEGEKGAL